MTAPGAILAALRTQYPCTAHMPPDMVVRTVREIRENQREYWRIINRDNDGGNCD